MKKFKIFSAIFAIAALPLFGIVSLVFADSPGQLSNGPDNYKVRNVTQNGAYAKTISASCNETVKYSIMLANSDFGLLKNLTVKANMVTGVINASAINASGSTTAVSGTAKVNPSAGSLVYLPGTTVRITSDGKSRTPLADGVTTGGVNAGELNGSTQTFVQFEAKVECAKPPEPPKPQALTCDNLALTIVNREKREVSAKVTGTASNTTISGYKLDFGDGTSVNQQSANHTYANYGKYTVIGYVTGMVGGTNKTVTSTACTKVVEFTKTPPPKPQSLTCDNLTLTIVNKDKREVSAKVVGTAEYTTISGYKLDFGDGTSVNQQSANHTYANYGKYTVTGYVTGMVDGISKTVTSATCTKTVEFVKPSEPPVTPPTESELPNTGAGSIIGLFTGVSMLGAIGHRMWISRRL